MNVNADLFNFINHGFQNPVFDSVMPILTQFGEYKFVGLVLVAVILYAHITKRKTLRRIAILTFGAFLVSDAAAWVIKYMVHEPRPYAVLDNVHLLLAEDDPWGFPSGHVTSVLAVVTYLVLNMKEIAEKNYKIIDALLIIFAVLIMFSRIYVGAHFPGDIAGGAIIGIIGALIVNRLKDPIIKLLKI